MTRLEDSERLREVFAMVKRIHEVGSPYLRMDQQALQKVRNKRVPETKKSKSSVDEATLSRSSEKTYGL
jgi:hypothetical protein